MWQICVGLEDDARITDALVAIEQIDLIGGAEGSDANFLQR